MIAHLAFSVVMVTATVTIHFGGLLGLLWILRNLSHRLNAATNRMREGLVILLIVLGLVGITTVEVWLYALAYLAVGALNDFETALYFSTTCFTTLGFGDIVLDRQWRIVSAIEGANGLLLFGWSTAFLISVTGRMRVLEHDWLERPPRP